MRPNRRRVYEARITELQMENEELRAQLKAAKGHKKRPPAEKEAG